jgi:hypothetical protein
MTCREGERSMAELTPFSIDSRPDARHIVIPGFTIPSHRRPVCLKQPRLSSKCDGTGVDIARTASLIATVGVVLRASE